MLHIKYEKKITGILKENCKPFYSYLRSKRIIKTSLGSLSKPDGTLSTDNESTAEVLADAFSSVFVQEPAGPLPKNCYGYEVTDCISDIKISFAEVKCELEKLDISKSQGPDNVHPKLLKSLADSFSFVSSVTKLFRTCVATGKIPSLWKEANVVALFKKGSKMDPLNYRPVSLTSILCKVYEKLIRRHIWQFVKDSN